MRRGWFLGMKWKDGGTGGLRKLGGVTTAGS